MEEDVVEDMEEDKVEDVEENVVEDMEEDKMEDVEEDKVEDVEEDKVEEVKDDKVVDDASKLYKGKEYHDMFEDVVDDSGDVTSSQGKAESAGQESEKFFSMFESAEKDDPSS